MLAFIKNNILSTVYIPRSVWIPKTHLRVFSLRVRRMKHSATFQLHLLFLQAAMLFDHTDL